MSFIKKKHIVIPAKHSFQGISEESSRFDEKRTKMHLQLAFFVSRQQTVDCGKEMN